MASKKAGQQQSVVALPELAKDAKDEKHCWSSLEPSYFKVRGSTYLTDREKIDHAAASIFELQAMESFRSTNGRLGRAAEHPGSYFARARAAGDTRFYLIVVYQGCSDPKEHMLIYFAMAENAFAEDGPVPAQHRAAVQRTWERFLNGSDEYRNARWKVIPGIPEGAWAVQKAFGNTPTLLATKLTHTWHCSLAPPVPSDGQAAPASSRDSAFGGAGAEGSSGSTAGAGAAGHVSRSAGYGSYLEVDCDVASSTMASYLVNLLLANAKDVVVNLGFVVEAQEEDELPEHLLGTATIRRPHYERMPKVAVGNLQQADAEAAEAAGSWGGWFGGWGGAAGEQKPGATPKAK